jgi:hypothetical protein
MKLTYFAQNILKYLVLNIYSPAALHRIMFFIFDIENWHMYAYATYSLKVSGAATVEYVTSTEWPPNSPDFKLLDYYVSNEQSV